MAQIRRKPPPASSQAATRAVGSIELGKAAAAAFRSMVQDAAGIFDRNRPDRVVDKEKRALFDFEHVVIQNLPRVDTSDFDHVLPQCQRLATAVTELLREEALSILDELITIRGLGSYITILVGHELDYPIPNELLVPGYIDPARRLHLSGKSPDVKLQSIDLHNYLTRRLSARLAAIDLGEATRATIADRVMADFQGASLSGLLESEAAADAIVELIVETALTVHLSLTSRYNEAAPVSLPKTAPETWAGRDRRAKENPIDFLRRVWGPYMDAGVLYQDDIKRLGDDKLVQRVRTYCHQKGLSASDVLPPPRQARIERALAEVTPGSPAERALRGRLENREASKRWRRSRAPAPD
jgi:hypothetical protein